MMVDRRHPPGAEQGSSALFVARPDSAARAEPEPVPLYRFQPPVGTPYGLEVTTVEDFHADHDDWPWNPPRPGRATFHYLILVTEGELRHDVDHVTCTVAPGQWLWVRPGHVQCWHDPGTARGPFILFEPEALRPDTARELAPLTAHDAPAVLTPQPDDAPWLEQTAFQLLDEHRALGRRPLTTHHALRCSLLEALLLRLANSPDITEAPVAARTTPLGGTSGRQPLYERFLDALELHYRELHRVDDYARLLGCSVRTLSRTTRAATGTGARQVIDQRRLLEARRLLGHARWTARAVADQLGFTDTANFGRFFRHHTGLTPAAYATRQATPDP
ncbi:helix-turn-helix domain-containing protein [Streptomyces sp. NPDC058676]|uniref:helix-turn-helix domain-containing protein n=1 Tax=unclassified Streptomyces TaxID=2593676 RepID=UPI0036463080